VRVAKQLQIDEVHAGFKARRISNDSFQELKQRGAKVAVAGDGLKRCSALAGRMSVLLWERERTWRFRAPDSLS